LEQSSARTGESEHELDLGAFYDLQNPASYEKEYAYSVLESLINDNGQLTRQIKGRKYRYSDLDYSSECEDPLIGYERFKTAKSKSKSSNSTKPASSLSGHIRWLESDTDQLESSSRSSNGSQSKLRELTRQMTKKSARKGHGVRLAGFGEQRSISTTDPISEEGSSADENQLDSSYYITEVSFSAN